MTEFTCQVCKKLFESNHNLENNLIIICNPCYLEYLKKDNEAHLLSETMDWLIQRTRLLSKDIKPTKILVTSNPSSNWVQDMFRNYKNNEPEWGKAIIENAIKPIELNHKSGTYAQDIVKHRMIYGDWEYTETDKLFEFTCILLALEDEFDYPDYNKVCQIAKEWYREKNNYIDAKELNKNLNRIKRSGEYKPEHVIKQGKEHEDYKTILGYVRFKMQPPPEPNLRFIIND